MFLLSEKNNKSNRILQLTSFWKFIWIVCCTFVFCHAVSPVNGIRKHGRKRRKLQTVGQFIPSFKVVKAGLPSTTPLNETVVGVYNNRSTVNLTPFNNAGISVMIPFTCCFTSVAITFEGVTTVDTSAPYSVFGNVRQNFTNVPGLNVTGPKIIFVAGYSGSTLVATLNLSFVVIRSPLAPTFPAPMPVSLPVPITVAVSEPSTKPSSRPSAAPSSAPTNRPIFVDSNLPSAEPSEGPSSMPLRAPMTVPVPVRPPVLMPVPVPVSIPVRAPIRVTKPPLMLDTTKILEVAGDPGVQNYWADSYSVGGNCYCSTTFDHGIGDKIVMTPLGNRTVRQICSLLRVNAPPKLGRPLYNDINCGNGPINDDALLDEVTCPGRVDWGVAGCGHIGPTWNFSHLLPVPVPVPAPVMVPIPIMVAPAPAPVMVPIPIMVAPVPVAPTPATSCTIPKFLSPWQRYPVKPGGTVAVAQGGAIGTDFIVFGGYAVGLSSATNRTWAFNTTSQKWRELDNIPIPWGITHMPNVIVGNNIYTCGGYWNGTDPGLPAQKQCFKYTHGNVNGSQWTSLPDLPDIRAGGAMIYDIKRNSVTYATGADFHSPNPPRAVDWPTAWELEVDNVLAGWKLRTNAPYSANHVGTASVLYRGVERHYVVGGQEAHNEFSGQYNLLYEYDANGNTWTQRANLANGTSHIQSSVFPYKECGFFVVGGKHNRYRVSRSVMYYDITTDQWSKVGDTPVTISASVCDSIGATIYCQSGCIGCDFSWRIQIE